MWSQIFTVQSAEQVANIFGWKLGNKRTTCRENLICKLNSLPGNRNVVCAYLLRKLFTIILPVPLDGVDRHGVGLEEIEELGLISFGAFEDLPSLRADEV